MWCHKVKTDEGYRIVYGKTQKELKDKLRVVSVPLPRVTFGQAAEEWLEKHSEDIGPVTLRGYAAAQKRAVKALGSLPLTQLRPVDLSRFLTSAIKGNKMAEKTAKTQLMVIRLVCRYAVQVGYIDSDPSSSLAIPSGLQKTRRKLPSQEDINKIKASVNLPYGLFAMIALYTGLRRGEILALRKEDIDVENQMLYVRHAMLMDHSRIQIKDPKTEAGVRVVGIPDGLLPYLRDIPDGFVFQKNGKPLTENQHERRWEQYVAATGISCTPHQLRHAYTSALIANNLTPEETQRLVGHAQISTTMDIYTHLKQERAQQIAKKSLSVNF